MFTKLSFSQEKIETGDINFNFKKTETFDSGTLEEILLLPKEKYFNRTNLADDLQRLNKYYFDNGFFEVLIDTSTSFDKDDNEMNVTFTIIENSRYTIREITMQGLDKISDQLRNDINQEPLIKPGQPYVKALITQEKDRILNLLQNNGYYYAQIDTGRSRADSSKTGIIIGKYSEELQKDPEFKNKVVVKFRFIGTEDIYRFGRVSIKIQKNKYHLSKDVIERELKFKQGDVYSKAKMLESERNFTKLALIQLGRVMPDTVIEEDKTVDMDVNITLGNKYELTPSIAAVFLANKFYAGASVEYKDKNFFGGGRVFTIEPAVLYNSPSSNLATLTFSIFQPYLFKDNITATLSSTLGFYNINELFESVAAKNLLRLTYFIADFTFYNNAYSDFTFDYVRDTYKQDVIDENIIYRKGTRLHTINSILGLTLIHNNTDNIFNPTKGFYHSITAESAGGFPRFLSLFINDLLYSQYVKLYTPNSFYFDIADGRKNSIVATHFEIGDIIEYGTGENLQPISPLYKFYCGGGNSLRGWGAQECGILSNPKLGGKFLVEGSLEWRRRPFPQRSFLYPVWGVLFFDWGNLWETGSMFRMDQIALATGFGIRYDTFIGPVRIDLGFKLFDPLGAEGNKWLWDKPSDIFKNKYAIQFGLGNAF